MDYGVVAFQLFCEKFLVFANARRARFGQYARLFYEIKYILRMNIHAVVEGISPEVDLKG